MVLYGDAGVLCVYGSVQGIFDSAMRPVNALLSEPMSQPIAHAPAQCIVIAAIWILVTLLMNGYRPSSTRSREALVPLLVAWLLSASVALALSSPLGIPLAAESEFVLGALCVVAGWRVPYALDLPLP